MSWDIWYLLTLVYLASASDFQILALFDQNHTAKLGGLPTTHFLTFSWVFAARVHFEHLEENDTARRGYAPVL